MIKDKLISIKQKAINKYNSVKNLNNKKKIENLFVFIIISIITIVCINYIWKDEEEEPKVNIEYNKKLAQEMDKNINEDYNVNLSNNENDTNENKIEKKLENILSNIRGVGKTKVLLTYSTTNQIIPMYDEDTSKSSIEEKDSGGGTRVSNESSIKKDIIYKEEAGIKIPITQNIINPKIEGAIITAQGANDENIKTSIIQAVEAATGLSTYKIQVFEMKKEG